jgi:hypothetical protein
MEQIATQLGPQVSYETIACEYYLVGMYVCITGGPEIRHLHSDLQ